MFMSVPAQLMFIDILQCAIVFSNQAYKFVAIVDIVLFILA